MQQSAAARRAARHGRLDGVQYLRALAALAVTVSHILGDIVYHGGPNLFPAYYVGAAGVDLFFVISGFVMVYTARDRFGVPGSAADFLRRRLARIVPLYWLATAAYCAVQIGQGKWAVVRPELVASSLVFWPYADAEGLHLPVYSIGWTLEFEMMFYAAFAGGLPFRRLGLPLVVVGLLALVTLGSAVTLPQPLRFWAEPVLIDFLLGIGLGLAHLGGWRLPRAWAVLACLLAVTLVVGGTRAGFNAVPNVPERFPRWIAWGIPAALLFAGTVLRAGPPGRPRPWLLRLGAASYALYLVHPLVVIEMRPLLPHLATLLGRLPGGRAAAGSCDLIIVLALTIGAALAIHAGVEKPLTRWISRGLSMRRSEEVVHDRANHTRVPLGESARAPSVRGER